MEITIPQQWREMRSMGPIAGRIGTAAYGAGCATDEDGIEYMCAVEVADFAHAPQGLGRMRVPAARYAVFTHDGHVSALPETWKRIWSEWFPASGFTAANTPDFELYDERFDPETGSGIVEIWFPVEADSQT